MAMPKIGDEVTAVLDGVLAADGGPIVLRARVGMDTNMVQGDFQVCGVGGFDIRDFVNEAEEGVMWLHGWGEETEAALRAAYALAERIPLRPPLKDAFGAPKSGKSFGRWP